jgi:3-hydroxybutyryl-CoA dehydrogenase
MTSRNYSIETIGIVGTGAMGRGIAQIAALAGLTVRLYDTNPAAVGAARDYLADTFAKLTAKGKLEQSRSLAALALVSGAQAVGDLADCDLVIEAIVEKLDVKRALFRELETVVSGRCVLASNTSSLSITSIAAGCTDPTRVVGYHFFNPVPLMKVVEVIDGLRSDPAAGDALMDLARRMGHTPVRAKDMPGFIVNHAGRGMNTEGLRVAGEGVASFVEIDRIMREQAGFRLGPFELLDLTAPDVSHPVMESIYHQFYEEPRFTPSPITGTRLAGGLIGRKTGEGFYRYDDGKQQVPEEAPAPSCPSAYGSASTIPKRVRRCCNSSPRPAWRSTKATRPPRTRSSS